MQERLIKKLFFILSSRYKSTSNINRTCHSITLTILQNEITTKPDRLFILSVENRIICAVVGFWSIVIRFF